MVRHEMWLISKNRNVRNQTDAAGRVPSFRIGELVAARERLQMNMIAIGQLLPVFPRINSLDMPRSLTEEFGSWW